MADMRQRGASLADKIRWLHADSDAHALACEAMQTFAVPGGGLVDPDDPLTLDG